MSHNNGEWSAGPPHRTIRALNAASPMIPRGRNWMSSANIEFHLCRNEFTACYSITTIAFALALRASYLDDGGLSACGAIMRRAVCGCQAAAAENLAGSDRRRGRGLCILSDINRCAVGRARVQVVYAPQKPRGFARLPNAGVSSVQSGF
ncbi:unnamed protein product, partial [Iphiclides podalirius]